MTAEPKQPIRGLLREELAERLKEMGEPAFRAEQIRHWLYRRPAETWEEMRNVPNALREKLERAFDLSSIEIVQTRTSDSGARKLLCRLRDGEFVEEVLIPAPNRRTVCLSSQVGCAFDCAFCASGKTGKIRNLSAGEIVDQAVAAQRLYGERLTNVVFMGVGEPFDNYDEVLRAIRLLNDPDGFGLGARRITISTCGVVPGIKRLEKEGLQVELSVSLHAPTDAIRDRIMPVNRKWPLDELMAACQAYVRKTRRIVTFEYVLIRDVNDSDDACRRLVERLRRFPCRANLIPYGEIAEYAGRPAPRERFERFARELERAGINVTVRRSKGGDVDAACGQLRSRHARKNA